MVDTHQLDKQFEILHLHHQRNDRVLHSGMTIDQKTADRYLSNIGFDLSLLDSGHSDLDLHPNIPFDLS